MARKIRHRKKSGREKNHKSIWETGRKIDWKIFLACLIFVFAVAGVGSYFTKIDSWYESVKPSITPSNWIFPVVWTILFYLITLSLYYTIISAKGKHDEQIGIIFGINFLLNILWSVFYFTMHEPVYAFVDIILLIASIISLIIFCWKIDKRASIILIPYLVWVCFASVLNYLTILNIR